MKCSKGKEDSFKFQIPKNINLDNSIHNQCETQKKQYESDNNVPECQKNLIKTNYKN